MKVNFPELTNKLDEADPAPLLTAEEEDAILTQLKGLDLREFRYITETVGSHIGPSAQDFAIAFSVGNDAAQIHEIDALGILVAAIKALNRRVDILAS